MTEKQIPGYPEYTVDTEGNIYSFKRGTKYKMRQNIDATGYPSVHLSLNGKAKRHNIHRVVAEVFIPNPENKPCVNHKNSVRHDNSVSNLEWVTYSENNLHGREFGHNKPLFGEDAHNALITNEVARSVYLYLMCGHRNIEAAEKFNIPLGVVTGIKSRRSYGCATSDLPDLELLPNTKRLSEGTVRLICDKICEGLTQPEILRQINDKNVKLNIVKDIKRRKTYTKISSEYDW